MNAKEYLSLAHDLFSEAYEHQMEGDLETAVELYLSSIKAFPTPEAHTFLGWTYGSQGKLDEAIAECKKAIQVDPEYGHAYNDIGMYLIEKSEHEDAIPWLQKAVEAKRYETPHIAHFNLGRVYLVLELLNRARAEFEESLRLNPDFEPAKKALLFVRKSVN